MCPEYGEFQKSDKDREKSTGVMEQEPAGSPVTTPVDPAKSISADRIAVIHCAAKNGNRPAATWHEAGQETFRVLRHRLAVIRRHRSLKTILVTSTVPEEGKTMVAVNLAIMLARAAQRVLLIDADLRNPDVHRVIGLPSLPGLGELLEDRVGLNAALRRVEPYGLYFLPAGSTQQNPGESLGRSAVQQCLALCSEHFDWVVLDSPPLLPFVDAHHLATAVDGVVMVVRPGVTPRTKMRQALAGLDRGALIGMVLNGTKDEQYEYYRYYERQQARLSPKRPGKKSNGDPAISGEM